MMYIVLIKKSRANYHNSNWIAILYDKLVYEINEIKLAVK